jgi:hypothetical protein
MSLRHPIAIAEPGFSVITGFCIDFTESFTHGNANSGV